jgi:hypothetical protein
VDCIRDRQIDVAVLDYVLADGNSEPLQTALKSRHIPFVVGPIRLPWCERNQVRKFCRSRLHRICCAAASRPSASSRPEPHLRLTDPVGTERCGLSPFQFRCRLPLNNPDRRAEESTCEVSALGRVPLAAFNALVRRSPKLSTNRPAPSSEQRADQWCA